MDLLINQVYVLLQMMLGEHMEILVNKETFSLVSSLFLQMRALSEQAHEHHFHVQCATETALMFFSQRPKRL